MVSVTPEAIRAQAFWTAVRWADSGVPPEATRQTRAAVELHADFDAVAAQPGHGPGEQADEDDEPDPPEADNLAA
jgi:hypothetical protein